MKEFKLKSTEIIQLSNNLTALKDFVFPGALNINYNILSLKQFVLEINGLYKKILLKHFDKKVQVQFYKNTGETSQKEIDLNFFNAEYHDISSLQIEDEEKRKKFEKEWNKVNNMEYSIVLKVLDTMQVVYVVKDKIQIILRDYLEQVITPINLLFYPSELGVIINLFK